MDQTGGAWSNRAGRESIRSPVVRRHSQGTRPGQAVRSELPTLTRAPGGGDLGVGRYVHFDVMNLRRSRKHIQSISSENI